MSAAHQCRVCACVGEGERQVIRVRGGVWEWVLSCAQVTGGPAIAQVPVAQRSRRANPDEVGDIPFCHVMFYCTGT